jgi:hypothetical protein
MPLSIDTTNIQLRKIYARTPTNGFIPSSFILISNGDGSTSWNSVSSIMEVSSFKTIKGNTATTYSADLSYNLLQISTTGVQGVLESYVDPATRTLMLSNYLPPFLVSQGSVPIVSDTSASNVPNQQSLRQVTGQSTIKFLGVGDVQFSTVTNQNAIFVSISTFTSRGYLTISGETFAWRPTLSSILSTSYGRPSFVSSVPFASGLNGWNWGSNIEVSTPVASRDVYFSSITFQMDHIAPYIDVTKTSSTRIFIEYNPMIVMSSMFKGPESMIKEISTFIQIENEPSGRVVFGETVTTNYITSQQSMASGNSNYFNTPIRMEVNPYTSFLSNYALNNSNTINMTIYHRIVDAQSDGTSTGFNSNINTIMNFTPKVGGLYINLTNQSPVIS